jgi:hypothetical protein
MALLHILSISPHFRDNYSNRPAALDEVLQSLERLLAGLHKRTEPRMTKGLRKLKWPFTKLENSKMVEEIERLKGTLQLFLGQEMYNLPGPQLIS